MRISWINGLVFFSLLGASAWAGDGAEYRVRYPLANAKAKLVDNQGNGFEPLYGTRNFRAVLNGVHYRGGANNYYHKTHKRSNKNPLPGDGLQNLCEEGFSTAIYLYTTNYGSAPHTVNCRMNDGSTNVLQYLQVSILSASNAKLHEVLSLIADHVHDPKKGPIYTHCWNGWHASGLTSAYTLRQFCGLTAEQTVAYWNANTDGHNGSSYEGIRKKIRAFVPFPDLSLSDTERAKVCPNPATLNF